MIDREGLFSPNATSRGEPDSDKLAYLSLRINGLAGDDMQAQKFIACPRERYKRGETSRDGFSYIKG